MESKPFVSNLIKARIKLGYSPETISYKLSDYFGYNVFRQVITKWEGGKKTPTLEQYRLLCNFYNLSFDDFYNNKLIF